MTDQSSGTPKSSTYTPQKIAELISENLILGEKVDELTIESASKEAQLQQVLNENIQLTDRIEKMVPAQDVTSQINRVLKGMISREEAENLRKSLKESEQRNRELEKQLKSAKPADLEARIQVEVKRQVEAILGPGLALLALGQQNLEEAVNYLNQMANIIKTPAAPKEITPKKEEQVVSPETQEQVSTAEEAAEGTKQAVTSAGKRGINTVIGSIRDMTSAVKPKK